MKSSGSNFSNYFITGHAKIPKIYNIFIGKLGE